MQWRRVEPCRDVCIALHANSLGELRATGGAVPTSVSTATRTHTRTHAWSISHSYCGYVIKCSSWNMFTGSNVNII